MTITQIGNPKKKTMLILSPFMANATLMENLFDDFKRDFNILIYVPSGHSDKKDYYSAKDEKDAILNYLRKNDIYQVEVLYGASLGARIAIELLKNTEVVFDHIILDGTPLYESADETETIIDNFFLSEYEKARISFHDGKKFISHFYGDICTPELTNQFINMSEKTIKNVLHDCTHCQIPELSISIQKKMHILYGEKEDDYEPTKPTWEEYYPNADYIVFEGMNHLQKLINDKETYIDLLYSIIFSY